MRIKLAVVSLVAALGLVAASVAVAAVITGTDGDDTLLGLRAPT
jgi:hypothetical protein